jgi:hypothetical protein
VQGALDHRVEDRGEVAGRRIDDLQYLGGRGLLFQGLARLGQQPRILHRDDCLRREVLQQRDLLFGERPDLGAEDQKHPHQCCVFAQREGETAAGSAKLDQGASSRVAR